MFKPIWGVLCALLVVAASAEARPRPRPPRAAEARGFITALTAPTATTPGEITLRVGSATLTLNVLASTEIEIEDDPTPTFAELLVGQFAKVKYQASTFNALEIEVEDQDIKVVGRVTAAGLDAGTGLPTLSLDLTNDGIADLTLLVDDETRIELGNLLVDESDLGLLVGLRVAAEYSSLHFLAKEIEVDLSGAARALGEVTAVDLTAGTFTIATPGGPLTFLVPEVEPRPGHNPVPLANLQVGDLVEVLYVVNGAGQNVAVEVDEERPEPRHVNGALVAVAGNTLTVRDRGADVILTVDTATDLRLNGKVVTVAQLADALAGGQVKISADYVAEGGVNLATKVRANGRSRGRGPR
jgi:hypothetical protein